jgi:Ca2+-binding EF-hand superfamily protein
MKLTQHSRGALGFALAALAGLACVWALAYNNLAYAQAQAQPAASEKKRHAKLDVNNDGQISREEAARHGRLAERFEQLDSNRDGQLSRDEIQSAQRGGNKSRFSEVDANADGMIDRSEAAKHGKLAERFDVIDANKDGKLSKEELRAYRATHGGRPGRP